MLGKEYRFLNIKIILNLFFYLNYINKCRGRDVWMVLVKDYVFDLIFFYN